MFFVSFISTVTSFLYLFCFEYSVVAYIIKAVCWVLLSLILFLKKQKFFISSFIFLLSTFLVGGALTFITSLIGESSISGRIDFSFPLGLIVIGGYVVVFITKRIYIAYNKGKIPQNLIYTVKLSINGVPFTLKGFLDTGNRLIDDKNGLPVVIVKVSSIIKGFSPSTFANLIEKGKANCISYATVTGGVSKIMIAYPDYFDIVGVKGKKDIAIGISFSGFYGDYDMILHPALINQ